MNRLEPCIIGHLNARELNEVRKLTEGKEFGNSVVLPTFIGKYCRSDGRPSSVRGGPMTKNGEGVRNWHQNNVPPGYNNSAGKFRKINRSKPFFLPEGATARTPGGNGEWPTRVAMLYLYNTPASKRTQIKLNQKRFNGSNAVNLNNVTAGNIVVHRANVVHRAPNGETPVRLIFTLSNKRRRNS